MSAGRLRGPLVAGGFTSALFLLMANEGRVPMATVWGILCLLAACAGLLEALGLLRPPGAGDVQLSDTWLAPFPGEPRLLAPIFALPAALLLVLASATLLPRGLPIAIAVALAGLVPAALRRSGLLVFVLSSALILPTLGAFPLWDPWETHYGEVAREILARDDWISLWWAQDRWFWSKPILIFWLEALTWNGTLVPFTADSQFQHTEWILRLPIYAFAIGALLAVHHLVARRFSARAGVLAALVLATTPYFSFLSHQAITDMYLVACVTVAVCLLLLATAEDPEREVVSYRVAGVALNAQHLVIALLVCAALPQILYLASRNVALIDGFLFAWHEDDYFTGSAGNDGVPGNPRIRLRHPAHRALFAQPIAQALLWLLCLSLLLWRLVRERRVQGLQMVGFYLCCALGFMGKGLPGVALPGLVALLYLLSTRRWSLLLEGRLRVGFGVGVITSVALPWFVAMFVRHGRGFIDRILIHDHINRLTRGVHGDTGGIEYYIVQFGHGIFPWVALAPAALAYWLTAAEQRSPTAAGRGEAQERRMVLIALGLWFLATFALFSAMTTKFHHYIFPAAPPAAMLIGLTLDRMLGPSTPSSSVPRARAGVVLAALSAVPLVIGVGSAFGDVRGVIPEGVPSAARATWVFQHAWPAWASALLLAAGVALLVVAARLQRANGPGAPAAHASWLSAGVVVGAVAVALAGRDLSWSTTERPIGNERLAQLFIYNYTRPWPEELDYRAVLTGFACVATCLTLCAAHRRLRPLMTQSLLGLGLCFSVWCLDVYMIDATPHWTQGHLVERYYKARKGPEEPLLAWQMNWKGENYYTGNRVFVFQDLDNKKIKRWLDDNEGKHAFFVLEHKRLGRFRRMMKPRKVQELTTVRDCNKFILVEADI